MARLLVHVEGETEEGFVNTILRPYLAGRGFESIGARLLGNARQRDRRGGIRGWDSVRNDLVRHLRSDPTCIMTTLVDYYGLPQSGRKAWPGRGETALLPVAQKGRHIEAALLADLGGEVDSSRFVPFVVVHEFEGLLFSDCHAFADAIARSDLAGRFQEIRDEFATPEHINDSPLTAPSKRVEHLVPEYQKPLFGRAAASAVGLATMRSSCPHFAAWLTRLETAART